MQAVIPLMRAQGGGSIVNINSGTAFMTVPQYSVYSSSKRALLGFSLTSRPELEKDGSSLAPFEIDLQWWSICCSRFPVGDGNTNWQFGRWVCFRSRTMSSQGVDTSD